MELRILLFAGLAEMAGKDCLDVSATELGAGERTVASLRQYLELQLPSLAASGYRVAVDHSYVNDQFVLHEGQEIALIPPVSGG
jgi:sulfur-carrier protein